MSNHENPIVANIGQDIQLKKSRNPVDKEDKVRNFLFCFGVSLHRRGILNDYVMFHPGSTTQEKMLDLYAAQNVTINFIMLIRDTYIRPSVVYITVGASSIC